MPKLKKDLGTNELQQKKLMRFTDDPLDLCVERKLITDEQYRIAMRVRSLFNTIFGHLRIKAYEPADLKGASVFFIDDEGHRAEAQSEYEYMMKQLTRHGYDTVVSRICIHGHSPSFLRMNAIQLGSSAIIEKRLVEMQHFQDAMQRLEKISLSRNA